MSPIPPDGPADALLQNSPFRAHPPLLYAGYVACRAVRIGDRALLAGRPQSRLAKVIRRWTWSRGHF